MAITIQDPSTQTEEDPACRQRKLLTQRAEGAASQIAQMVSLAGIQKFDWQDEETQAGIDAYMKKRAALIDQGNAIVGPVFRCIDKLGDPDLVDLHGAIDFLKVNRARILDTVATLAAEGAEIARAAAAQVEPLWQAADKKVGEVFEAVRQVAIREGWTETAFGYSNEAGANRDSHSWFVRKNVKFVAAKAAADDLLANRDALWQAANELRNGVHKAKESAAKLAIAELNI